jgi:hypothetical protein
MTIEFGAANRILVSLKLRRAARIPPEAKAYVARDAPGHIALEMEANTSGPLVKRCKLKVWTSEVTAALVDETVQQARNSDCDSLHSSAARRIKAVQIVTRNPPHFQHVGPDIEI